MRFHEVIINAEEALDRVEGADFLYCVLIALRVRLLLGSISAEVEEGEARVEEVGHGCLWWPLGAPRLPLDTPRRRRELQRSRVRPRLPESSLRVRSRGGLWGRRAALAGIYGLFLDNSQRNGLPRLPLMGCAGRIATDSIIRLASRDTLAHEVFCYALEL